MLSILIPTFNYNCTLLVKDLYLQAIDVGIPFEIIVAEDGSTLFVAENSEITKLPFCQHFVLKKNIGRAANRNFLAKQAKYENLLFIDCDSKIVKHDFLKKYTSHFGKIILGGRIYNAPSDNNHTLLPKYGQKERITNEQEGYLFTSPNFLIPKSIFNEVLFDEKITLYGHEDTLFGCNLQAKGFKFFLIDNPVLHIQIEDNFSFLKKTELSIDNLWELVQKKSNKKLKDVSTLYKYYQNLHKFKIDTIIAKIFMGTKTILQKQLYSSNPSLFIFNCYKIGYLCHISNNKKTFCHK